MTDEDSHRRDGYARLVRYALAGMIGMPLILATTITILRACNAHPDIVRWSSEVLGWTIVFLGGCALFAGGVTYERSQGSQDR